MAILSPPFLDLARPRHLPIREPHPPISGPERSKAPTRPLSLDHANIPVIPASHGPSLTTPRLQEPSPLNKDDGNRGPWPCLLCTPPISPGPGYPWDSTYVAARRTTHGSPLPPGFLPVLSPARALLLHLEIEIASTQPGVRGPLVAKNAKPSYIQLVFWSLFPRAAEAHFRGIYWAAGKMPV